MISLTLNNNTQFINSKKVKIAYNVEGSGPPLLLLHGGMGSKKDWSTYGYVQALRDKYTLIAIDHRGHGESGRSTEPDEYSIEVLTGDVLSVADACGLDQFYVMGFSYGGSIALQLAASSQRVIKVIAIGTSLGSVLTPGFIKFNNGLISFWEPLLEDLKTGTLEIESLPKERQNQLRNMDVPSWVAIAHALPSWPIIEPEKVLCPILMLVGSENPDSVSGNEPYLNKLKQNKIEYKILEGLNHWREFTESKITLPHIINFLNTS